jgi:hypothetical protein
MKFNWGHGIFIFLTIFVLSMVFVVYKSFQQDNALVEKEYYPKGLEYQKQIDRIGNANSLSEKIAVEPVNGIAVVKYPKSLYEGMAKGKLFFYRPSDDAGDLEVDMKVDSSLIQKVPIDKLMNGKYLLKISWTMQSKEYFQEEVIHITR